MPDVNRRFLLKQRPEGRVRREDFELAEVPVPELGDGEALVRVLWLSLDPTNRVWMTDAPGYLPPVQIGEVMRGGALGRVVASRHAGYREGQIVQGLLGWQDYAVISDAHPALPVPDDAGVPLSAHLGALGMTGLTAYFGVTDVADVQPGETVVISAAAGAVGSVAGQIVKNLGARAVGLAGGPQKCAWLTGDLGFDAAIDYKSSDWRDQLAAATPDGIDVDFENVGGEIMEAVFGRLNIGARVALCGLISGYNDAEGPAGPRNFGNLISRRARVQGFLILDYFGRWEEGARQLASWMAEGRLQHRETVVEGLESAPTALNQLFDGTNTGKLVVHVAD
ncbi:MAG TPA: NADP-dependent oxidoreductase [Solirubrobacteraceae bacterium]|nr:NADP-dependent oxidoreductase [Solirubrobacteraceae bacterium]